MIHEPMMDLVGFVGEGDKQCNLVWFLLSNKLWAAFYFEPADKSRCLRCSILRVSCCGYSMEDNMGYTVSTTMGRCLQTPTSGETHGLCIHSCCSFYCLFFLTSHYPLWIGVQCIMRLRMCLQTSHAETLTLIRESSVQRPTFDRFPGFSEKIRSIADKLCCRQDVGQANGPGFFGPSQLSRESFALLTRVPKKSDLR